MTVFELQQIQEDIRAIYFNTLPELHKIHDENQRAEYIKWMNSGDY